ncbi:chemotaxis protein MotB [Rhodobacter xanthinilyticus]|uniref:Chemotaxis protein MotB n=1 Tax=Rhodobacter xanthinilyticus TaxID=1850250 RepID=A0A1D9M905_9RHOB|nr:flagellar motor protein MotB [Rhodobacter xanthinilyticus]AOZ68317.1 chemotaxis protein MotB [Rhodobacter xanthinilyticus]
MSARENAAPVIIKRKKVVGGDGHHGGAWKVAYADFVTAMMAFFLLMWLLNATTEKQRKGLADYFNPTIPINRISGGGEGAFGGDSVFSEDQVAQTGTGASAQKPAQERQAKGQQGEAAADKKEEAAKAEETAQLEKAARDLQQALAGVGGESMVTENLARHIVTRVTDEGLIVEFFDLEEEPLFVGETDEPQPVLREISKMLVRVFGLVKNPVALNGYSKSYPEMLRQNPVWDLSLARAQAMRQLLEADGLDKMRVDRVTGFADRRPASQHPMAVRNNRLELILLRNGK